MHYNLTITARADVDWSCNLFTMTEVHRFSIAAPPTARNIQDKCIAHKEKFLASWPHRRQGAPTLVPLSVSIELADGQE